MPRENKIFLDRLQNAGLQISFIPAVQNASLPEFVLFFTQNVDFRPILRNLPPPIRFIYLIINCIRMFICEFPQVRRYIAVPAPQEEALFLVNFEYGNASS